VNFKIWIKITLLTTSQCNKNEVTLYFRKHDPDFECLDEYKWNPHELPPVIITDGRLYVEDVI